MLSAIYDCMVEFFLSFTAAKLGTKIRLIEFLSHLTEQFKMLAGCLFGDHQNKQKINRCIINRIKGNFFLKNQQRTNDLLGFVQSTVGNGDTLSDSCAAQALTVEQIVENGVLVQFRVLLGDQLRYFFRIFFLLLPETPVRVSSGVRIDWIVICESVIKDVSPTGSSYLLALPCARATFFSLCLRI